MNARMSRHLIDLLWRGGAAGVLLALLLAQVAPGVALAQTAPPPPPGPPPVILPPPGTTVVQPTYPSVPPAGVPGVSPNGTIAVIPPTGGGAVAQITINLLGYVTTLIVPAHPTREIAVRIDAPPTQDLPAPLPSGLTGPVLVLSIDVFYADTGEEIHSHTPPLQLGIDPPEGTDAASLTLLRYDEGTGQYETVTVTVDPATGVLRAELAETSPFVLAGGAAGGAAPVPTAVIPGGLPRTGGSQPATPTWALVALVVGSGALLGLRAWRTARARE